MGLQRKRETENGVQRSVCYGAGNKISCLFGSKQKSGCHNYKKTLHFFSFFHLIIPRNISTWVQSWLLSPHLGWTDSKNRKQRTAQVPLRAVAELKAKRRSQLPTLQEDYNHSLTGFSHLYFNDQYHHCQQDGAACNWLLGPDTEQKSLIPTAVMLTRFRAFCCSSECV